MAKLTEEEKARRARQRMIDKALEYSIGTYTSKFVAPEFQKMIRAEAGASPIREVVAIVEGVVQYVTRKVGQCVCVTCGKTQAWDSGIKGMHTGHFLASRRASILLEEMNVAPQCSRCNYYESGCASAFRLWMETVRPEHIERLERLKTESRKFEKEELVDLRITYKKRLKKAEKRMLNPS